MSRVQQYQNIITAFKGTLSADLPSHVHLSNLSALLKKEFDFFWVGFYMRTSENTLTLGPYQGEIPCFTIDLTKGVCGTAAQLGTTQLIADVHSFPNYIACHPEPNAEIVVPGMKNGLCEFVLDVDHIEKNYFNQDDQKMLEQIVGLVLEHKLV